MCYCYRKLGFRRFSVNFWEAVCVGGRGGRPWESEVGGCAPWLAGTLCQIYLSQSGEHGLPPRTPTASHLGLPWPPTSDSHSLPPRPPTFSHVICLSQLGSMASHWSDSTGQGSMILGQSDWFHGCKRCNWPEDWTLMAGRVQSASHFWTPTASHTASQIRLSDRSHDFVVRVRGERLCGRPWESMASHTDHMTLWCEADRTLLPGKGVRSSGQTHCFAQ